MMDLYTLNIVKAKNQQLYYNKFEYSGTSTLEGSRYLRSCNTLDQLISTLLQRGKRWQHNYSKRNLTRDYNIAQLEKVMQFYQIHKHSDECCFRFSSSDVGFYTNDLGLLQEFYSLFSPLTCRLYQVEPAPPQIMYFAKEPKFKYRMYFKYKRLSKQDISDLYECLSNLVAKNEIAISSSLNRSMTYHNNPPLTGMMGRHRITGTYLSSQFFFEYDNEQTLSYMSLMLTSGLFGKRYKMEKRPES